MVLNISNTSALSLWRGPHYLLHKTNLIELFLEYKFIIEVLRSSIIAIIDNVLKRIIYLSGNENFLNH